jgi:hemoglobin-like flavoprotein
MDLGTRQFRAGVTPAHYGIARDLFLATVREMAGSAWSDELSTDIAEALNAVASIMIQGAGRARASAA